MRVFFFFLFLRDFFFRFIFFLLRNNNILQSFILFFIKNLLCNNDDVSSCAPIKSAVMIRGLEGAMRRDHSDRLNFAGVVSFHHHVCVAFGFFIGTFDDLSAVRRLIGFEHDFFLFFLLLLPRGAKKLGFAPIPLTPPLFSSLFSLFFT